MADQKKTRTRVGELKAMNATDLDAVVAAARKNIYQFRKDRLGKPVDDVKVVRRNRKEIARALTIKREQELRQA